jgi:branched-chain amino acid transport system ATP-binding protein
VTTPTEHKIKLKIVNLLFSVYGTKVLDNVSLDIYDNEILAVAGSDDAGRTGLLNCISGFSKPQSGDIYFEGKKITGIRPDKVTQLGLARTFQNIELFSDLTVLDNLMAARHVLIDQNFLTGALYFGPAHGEELDHRRAVEDIIEFLELQPIRHTIVGSLPDYQRKKVELGRSLATEPSVLLLDGLMAGGISQEKVDTAQIITGIFKGQGDTYPRTPVLRDGVQCIVLFAHNLDDILSIADRVIVLDSGKIIAQGTPAEVKANTRR